MFDREFSRVYIQSIGNTTNGKGVREMGDRVLIQVKSGTEFSPVCYLHWGGNDAPRLIQETVQLMTSRLGDVDYVFGRLVGVCHARTPGSTGLGCFNADHILTADDSHGDAGVYIIDCDTWDVTAKGGYGTSFNAAVAA